MALERRLMRVREQLEELARLIEDDTRAQARVELISGWSAAQHAEHVGRAHGPLLTKLVALAEQDDPSLAHGRMGLVGWAVLLTGYVPRGRAKAPERTRPVEGAGPAEARAQIEGALAALERLTRHRDHLGSIKARLEHPYFGRLSAVQWLRFIEIHQAHHLRIAAEIVAARG